MNTRIIGLVGAITLVGSAVGCLVEHDDEETGIATHEAQKTHAEIAASCTNDKKVAICHIPPGNPANAHTICISENAVDTHNAHHGDYIGPCDPGTDGSGGDASTTASSGSTSSGSTSSSSGSGGSTSTGSTGAGGDLTPSGEGECSLEYPSCNDHDDCEVSSSCLLGCCVPFTS